MPNFASDIDLLHWEPDLHAEAAWASQTLISGTGTLSGSTFTLASGSFSAALVQARHVLHIGGSVAGSYPIVSVDSSTQLTISALYDTLFDDGAPPVAPASGSDLPFTVRTFSPQIRIASDLLRQAAGIVPGTEDEDRFTILNPESLRRPCTLGALQMIYSALAAVAGENAAHYTLRADLYGRLYRRSLASTHVELDSNADGRPDTRRSLGLIEMNRV